MLIGIVNTRARERFIIGTMEVTMLRDCHDCILSKTRDDGTVLYCRKLGVPIPLEEAKKTAEGCETFTEDNV